MRTALLPSMMSSLLLSQRVRSSPPPPPHPPPLQCTDPSSISHCEFKDIGDIIVLCDKVFLGVYCQEDLDRDYSYSAGSELLPSVTSSALQQPTAFRPRLLLAGAPGSGQSAHMAPALLHHLDKLPVHRLDLPTLYSISAKTPEESCAQVTHTSIGNIQKYRQIHPYHAVCSSGG